MSTKGLARQATTGVTGFMLELPRMIEQAEGRGHPVIVPWPIDELGPMPEDKQRLYATFGVLVRFVQSREAG